MYIPLKRADHRKNDELRQVSLVPGFYYHSDGSCLAKFGNTQVLCAATIEEKVPPFLKHSKTGWICAEYGMLPCASAERIDREAAKGKQSGRTVEIQRLIGRSLRSVVDLAALGERQIRLDCDVLQADGGTRCASITGGFVALFLACRKLVERKVIHGIPIKKHAIAISAGLVHNEPMLDLDYLEDSNADIDANFVLSTDGIIEIQACGEKCPFSEDTFNSLLNLAKRAREYLIKKQKEALNIE